MEESGAGANGRSTEEESGFCGLRLYRSNAAAATPMHRARTPAATPPPTAGPTDNAAASLAAPSPREPWVQLRNWSDELVSFTGHGVLYIEEVYDVETDARAELET